MLELLRRYSGITVNYLWITCELPWITVNCLNYSELLGITWIFCYIFLLGYRFFNWAIIFFCWVIIFLLGQLGITTGFCWGYVFCQLIRSKLLWITVNCCELMWIAVNYSVLLWITVNWWKYSELHCKITVNCWNYFELHWITALPNSSWRKY
jgi:uncharacterized membrane protein (Fun14 family)